MNDKVIVLDCSQLAYKAMFVIGDLSFDELKTSVIFGFLKQLFKLTEEFEINKFVFCWDSKKSYRKLMYPSYKANRKYEELDDVEREKKNILYRQINQLRENIIPQLGFKNSFIYTGLEADDIIAYVVKKYSGSIVVSNDQDLYQLLGFCTLYDMKNQSKFNVKDFTRKYNISPASWSTIKAIAGCSTDNVKGIDGVGEFRAIKYFRNELPEGVIKERIESKEGKEIIRRNLALVELPFMPNKINIELNFNENFEFANWMTIFRKYGFNSFENKKYLNKLKENFNLL